MIRHTVVFKLKHAHGSAQERSFLQAARELAGLPTVRNFECLRQVSPKNTFEFGLSMEFASQQDYDAYNIHPEHVRFVQTRWIPEVEDFLEIDYAPFAAEA
jgi:Stress responsive A/B Barrel Domain